MKHLYILKGALASLALLPTLTASAEWQQIASMPKTQAHFITSEGVHLLSDFLDTRKGGIYYSEDNGLTWIKTDVKDYNYSTFYQGSEYLFALGYNGRVARSADGGRTWEVMNYTNALRGIIDEKGIDACVAYGMVEVNGRIYVGDCNSGGVLYSDDNGESWNVTDHESMTFSPDGVMKIVDAFYNVEQIKGQVYAFGSISVWRYDAEADKWSPVQIRSNFLGVATSFGDRLVCGRAVQNVDPTTEYLIWTEDGYQWNRIEAPEPTTDLGVSLNVRAIHSDDKYIFTAGPDGIRPDDNNPKFPYRYCPDFYYTSDFGETWRAYDGLPTSTFPLTIKTDDDYIYVALYSPVASNTDSGLWRLPKSDLEGSGVKHVAAESGAIKVVLSHGRLLLDTVAESVKVWNAAGAPVKSATSCTELNLSDLPGGMYMYKVASPRGESAGKIIL